MIARTLDARPGACQPHTADEIEAPQSHASRFPHFPYLCERWRLPTPRPLTPAPDHAAGSRSLTVRTASSLTVGGVTEPSAQGDTGRGRDHRRLRRSGALHDHGHIRARRHLQRRRHAAAAEPSALVRLALRAGDQAPAQYRLGAHLDESPRVRCRALILGRIGSCLRRGRKKADAQVAPQAVAASAKSERIRELERENAELRRANGILNAASAFFAPELDPRPPS
jgi:transposase-like protein